MELDDAAPPELSLDDGPPPHGMPGHSPSALSPSPSDSLASVDAADAPPQPMLGASLPRSSVDDVVDAPPELLSGSSLPHSDASECLPPAAGL